jgi:hypothetical protein
MKKIVAISLIWIFLFNVIGYYGIYAGMLHQSNKKAEQQIEDNNYDKSQTITFKIPLTLPYPVQNGFERLSGDFEHEGEFYKLVEQKYENDTVYIVCLRNNEVKKALEVANDFVKQSTDQSPSSNQNTKTLTGLLKDYNPVVDEITLASPEVIAITKPFISNGNKILNLDFPVPTPPPNGNC